jgi:hypothetical protein
LLQAFDQTDGGTGFRVVRHQLLRLLEQLPGQVQPIHADGQTSLSQQFFAYHSHLIVGHHQHAIRR